MASLTYETKTMKPDVYELVTNITAAIKYAVLTQYFSRGECTGVYHQWPSDTLRTGKKNTLHEITEWKDLVKKTRDRRMLGNYIQEIGDGATVSNRLQKALKYGVKDEIGYQIDLTMQAVGRDLEWALTLNQTTQEETATNCSEMGGMPYFLGGYCTKAFTANSGETIITATAHNFDTGDQVTVYTGAGGTLPGGIAQNGIYWISVVTDNTMRIHNDPGDAWQGINPITFSSTSVGTVNITTANVQIESEFNENALNNLLEKCFLQGGNPDIIVMSTANKAKTSTWTAGSLKNRDMTTKKLVMKVDFYESDYGDVALIPSRTYAKDNTSIMAIETQFGRVAVYDPFHVEDLPVTGNYKGKVIDGTATLEFRAPKSSGMLKIG